MPVTSWTPGQRGTRLMVDKHGCVPSFSISFNKFYSNLFAGSVTGNSMRTSRRRGRALVSGDKCQRIAVRSDNCQIGQLSDRTTVSVDNCQTIGFCRTDSLVGDNCKILQFVKGQL